MIAENSVVKALYEYEAEDSKVLSCTTDDLFIVLKYNTDWLYVVDHKGKLGYIPTNHVDEYSMSEEEYLNFVDAVLTLLDAKHNENNAITVRQINHAQIKLTQLRCELRKASQPKVLIEEPVLEIDEIAPTENESDNNLTKIMVDVFTQADFQIKKDNPIPEKEIIDVPVGLVNELIERLRVSTELSHGMCKLVIETVIGCIKDMIPELEPAASQITKQLTNEDKKCANMIESSDLKKFNALFRKLWFCKNDDQQRSWPVHEDEQIIKSCLQDIAKLFINAKPSTSQTLICKDNYDHVHMLVTYFQMETRRELRMELYSVMLEIVKLVETSIPQYFLSSVLPAALANEMLNYQDDVIRWTHAAQLFIAIFSTGHKPPVNIYEHINEQFINKLLDIIEGVDMDGNKVDVNIPPEISIPPILAFNLHFEDTETNLVLKALKARKNASQFTEILVSHLNWEEDPTCLSNILGIQSSSSYGCQNSVHKLLIEIFDDIETTKLFYYNDIRVIVDILVTHLNNLLSGDKTRISYLKLANNVIQSTVFQEEPHKLEEINKCLHFMLNNDNSSLEEKELAQKIKSKMPKK